MIGYSYVLPRDYGFAPNPFGEFCTLATCKPGIRKSAVVGDWVVGCGSAPLGMQKMIIYAMLVSEKLSFEEYWSDARFQYKKPVMNGSLKQMYGDNIYSKVGAQWHQLDSHHSNADGSPNMLNLERDTKQNNVLVSTTFYYFGREAIRLPDDIPDTILKAGIGYQTISEQMMSALAGFLNQNYSTGITGFPIFFEKFDRYDGK